ncbi:hypothetical protein [Pseudaminobacter sp. NGMCC 1.201702]|uniref:hypothetical protein n=1 Tax=Pseudaminobacter sp. NGMCC 1.201702 TaxID=3391825 RepID=UPI0039EFEF0C
MVDMTQDQRAAVTLLWQAWLPEGAEMIDLTAVLWSGWECDHHAALIRLADGAVQVKILSGVSPSGDDGPIPMVEERIAAHSRAAQETGRFLEIARTALERPAEGPGWACGSCGRRFHDEQEQCPACGATSDD